MQQVIAATRDAIVMQHRRAYELRGRTWLIVEIVAAIGIGYTHTDVF